MQTPKGRTNSSGASQRKSPQSIEVSNCDSLHNEVSEKVSPRVIRQLKTGSRYSEPTASSSNQATKALKERSPKVVDRKSLSSPISEKKRSGRVAELESQISQLENDLKTVKDQLCSSEASKKEALRDVEEYNQQVLVLSTKLEDSQKKLLEQQSLVPEEIEQDQTLLAEIEALQEKHSQDSAALTSALNEITLLKGHLETAASSEAEQAKHSESELLKLKENLEKNILLVEEMKNEVNLCKESEANAKAVVVETLTQLETAKKLMENLRSDGSKTSEAYETVAAELELSKTRINFLEELTEKLNLDIKKSNDCKDELVFMNLEVQQLRLALEAAEIRYNEEKTRNSEQMRNAFEMVEQMKSSCTQREANLEAELKKSKYLIEELKAHLMDKETELQGICEENEQLIVKFEKSSSGQRENELEKELENLKAILIEKERDWERESEINKTLESEIKEIENGDHNEILPDLEAARASEREALMKVGYMSEEVDKSNRKALRVAEQLEAAQVVNAEMEVELRRLKVQSDQWRKAAEAAAAMLSTNGQFVERTGSMDGSKYSPRLGRMHSPYGDEIDEDLMKKKNANMLRRIGVLWKKPHK